MFDRFGKLMKKVTVEVYYPSDWTNTRAAEIIQNIFAIAETHCLDHQNPRVELTTDYQEVITGSISQS